MKISNVINGIIIIGLVFLAIKYSSTSNVKDSSTASKTTYNAKEYKANTGTSGDFSLDKTPEKTDLKTSSQQPKINPKSVSKYTTNTIPSYIYDYSKKFSLWKDIFYGSKVYIVYSYKQGSDCTAQSQQYHDNIVSYVSRNSSYFADKPISPSQLDNDINKGLSNLENLYHKRFEEYANKNDREKINQLSKEIEIDNEKYQNLIDFVNACTLDTCIIDPKNRKYIKTDRDFNKLKTVMDSYKNRL